MMHIVNEELEAGDFDDVWGRQQDHVQGQTIQSYNKGCVLDGIRKQCVFSCGFLFRKYDKLHGFSKH